MHNKKNIDTTNAFTDVIGIYWGRNLQMIRTFLFVKLGEGEVC